MSLIAMIFCLNMAELSLRKWFQLCITHLIKCIYDQNRRRKFYDRMKFCLQIRDSYGRHSFIDTLFFLVIVCIRKFGL